MYVFACWKPGIMESYWSEAAAFTLNETTPFECLRKKGVDSKPGGATIFER